MNAKRNIGLAAALIVGSNAAMTNTAHATLGFADVVLDYFDSGAGPLPGPYGGENPGGVGFPVPVTLDVVLGDDPTNPVDFLSLPTGSFVTVGFTNEFLFDGPGDDLFIQETGGGGEEADVFISSDNTNFSFLGTAVDNGVTSFDFNAIGFAENVSAVKIVGKDNGGSSPGFDVVNVQGLTGSFTPRSVPEFASTAPLLVMGLGLLLGANCRRIGISS